MLSDEPAQMNSLARAFTSRDEQAPMAKSSQLMPLINTGNYRGGTNDKPGPTI